MAVCPKCIRPDFNYAIKLLHLRAGANFVRIMTSVFIMLLLGSHLSNGTCVVLLSLSLLQFNLKLFVVLVGVKIILYYSYRVVSQSTVIEVSNIGSRTDKVQKTMWTLGK